MSNDPSEFLRHIRDESVFIISTTQNIAFEDFIEDETLKRAIVRSLEIIG